MQTSPIRRTLQQFATIRECTLWKGNDRAGDAFVQSAYQRVPHVHRRVDATNPQDRFGNVLPTSLNSDAT